MSSSDRSMDLTVSVSADEWAWTKRRIIYLEAVVVQVLRDRKNIKEWYTALEIAAIGLPGLPRKTGAVTRYAKAHGWKSRKVAKRGQPNEYHFASLPARAFDALISKIVNVPKLVEDADQDAELQSMPEIEPAPEKAFEESANTAPPWVLPYMRLLKGGAKGNVTIAWRELPNCLPAGVVLPTREEAAATLQRLGLLKAN